MATANSVLRTTRLSQKFMRTYEHPRESNSLNLVMGLDRLLLSLKCPMHSWTWPRANTDERIEGFDAHQTCFKCDSKRFWDSRGWQPGPVYRRPTPGAAEI
jgi:hypothetical protein